MSECGNQGGLNCALLVDAMANDPQKLEAFAVGHGRLCRKRLTVDRRTRYPCRCVRVGSDLNREARKLLLNFGLRLRIATNRGVNGVCGPCDVHPLQIWTMRAEVKLGTKTQKSPLGVNRAGL